jgi:hypothetical protein
VVTEPGCFVQRLAMVSEAATLRQRLGEAPERGCSIVFNWIHPKGTKVTR